MKNTHGTLEQLFLLNPVLNWLFHNHEVLHADWCAEFSDQQDFTDNTPLRWGSVPAPAKYGG